MSYEGRNLRAYRPSQLGRLEEQEDDFLWREKQKNMLLYAERAQAGLPLFGQSATEQTEATS